MKKWIEHHTTFLADIVAVRIPDGRPVHLEPNQYQKVLLDRHPYIKPAEEPRWEFWFCAPNGTLGKATHHTIEEHDDGTISLHPSVWFKPNTPEEWHSMFFHGVWKGISWPRECPGYPQGRVSDRVERFFSGWDSDTKERGKAPAGLDWLERWRDVPRRE